jgi:8-oxo-dGTP pyrophosphatase MutT (NUDIX family)
MNPQDVHIQSCFVAVSEASIARQGIETGTGPRRLDRDPADWPGDTRPATRLPRAMPPEAAIPRPAAVIILLRRGGRHSDRGVEVLLARRGLDLSFMPGVWVFPGGMVEPGESEIDCATRELAEEVGIGLGSDARIQPWARWITPEVVPVRFDTIFFVALAPAHSPPRPDGVEVTEADWFQPQAALETHHAGELDLVFPTIKTLETLLPYDSSKAVLDAAAERDVDPILPRVTGTREDHRVVLPGEEGYEEAGPGPPE